jgi:CTP synthase (UTP-ammonia lyase)
MIEAIRRPGGSYMAAVQWHPEFHRPQEGTLNDRPLLDEFLAAARAARAKT